MSEKFLQGATIESCFIPVTMDAAANTGDWLSLENYRRALLVLFKAIGTAGDDPVLTLQQATSAAGAGAKALTFTTIYEKVGATAITGVAQWTRVAQAAANTYTNAASAEGAALIAVEIDAADLDVANGFTFIQLSVPDVGTNAQLGCAFAILFDPRYPQATMHDAKA